MKTVEELYLDYKKICEKYSVEAKEEIKKVISDKIEYIKTRENEFYIMAKKSIDFTDKKYIDFKGKIKINTIIKKFEKVHIHMLVLWDEMQKSDFVLCDLKQGE
jgi:hypothetical protein